MKKDTVGDFLAELEIFFESYKEFRKVLKAVADREKLHSIDLDAFRFLHWAHSEPLPNEELLRRTGWSRPHLSQKTKALVSQNFLTEKNGSDRRKVIFEITPEGEEIRFQMETVAEKAICEVWPNMGGRIGLFIGALKKLNGTADRNKLPTSRPDDAREQIFLDL